jgi:hypothetical protein
MQACAALADAGQSYATTFGDDEANLGLSPVRQGIK